MSEILDTPEAIDAVIFGADPKIVVGLNRRGHVQLQFPAGKDYATFLPGQADELAELLRKWAKESRRAGHV
jgi:hypothetical protein